MLTRFQSGFSVEETIARLENRKEVQGVVIVDRQGRIVRSTVAQDLKTRYAALFLELAKTVETTMAALDSEVRIHLVQCSLIILTHV